MKKWSIFLTALFCVACSGEKPLTLAEAVNDDNLPAVQMALERGANVNALNADGKTALITASENGQTEIVKLLLHVKADPNLAAAVAEPTFGTTALILASQNNHANIVDVLLSAGANANQADANGKTPLIAASEMGHPAIVELLLKNGAHVNAQTKQNVTALMLAAYEGHVPVVQVLLKAGADLTLKDVAGRNASACARKPRLVLMLQPDGK